MVTQPDTISCRQRLYGPFVILILLTCCQPIYAQQPGGVGPPFAWFTGDTKNSKSTLMDISELHWQPLSGTSSRNINFHPAVYPLKKTYPFNNLSFEQGTIVGIFYPEDNNHDATNFLTLTYNNLPWSLSYSQLETIFPPNTQLAGSGKKTTAANVFATADNSMRTAVSFMATRSVTYSIWPKTEQMSLRTAFEGFIPELIFYKRALSIPEINRVQTYLAIKYGITLDTVYKSRNGTTLWDMTDPDLGKFNHRVTAIGKDLLAAINQPKSNTTYGEDAYNHDANGKSDDTPQIPNNDSTSVWRSLTIGFADRTMKNVADSSYLFWGDNDQPNELDDTEPDKVNYPGLLISKRKFLIYNQFNIKEPAKVEVGGDLHGELYDYYDYLKFRFVLVSLNKATNAIDSTRLFSYFGRVVFHDENGRMNFYDNKTVWDSIYWVNNAAGNKHLFSFAKVPLLRFNQVNTERVTIHGSTLAVYVESNVPISPVLHPDPVKLNFKKDAPIVVTLNFTKGIPPYNLRIDSVTAAGPKKVSEVIIRSNSLTGTDLTVELPPDAPQTEQSDKPVKIKANTNPGKKVTFYSYTINSLKKNTIYLFTITDKVKQTESIQVSIIQPVTPPAATAPKTPK